MHPADFYTGIVADLYQPLKSFSPDAERYARLLAELGEPALELGCGDGEPLLELRRRGLDVDGVDSSADMLDRCRRAADDAGLDVVLHHQRMEDLDLPRRYRTVFLAGPTFTLLADDDVALAALRGIGRHLTDDGTAVVPLFRPEPTPAGEIGRIREATGAEGAVLRVSVRSVERDEVARTQHTVLRYERHVGAEADVEDRTWTLHWHTREGFAALAEAAGLTVVAVLDDDGAPAAADATDVTVRLRPGSRPAPPR